MMCMLMWLTQLTALAALAYLQKSDAYLLLEETATEKRG